METNEIGEFARGVLILYLRDFFKQKSDKNDKFLLFFRDELNYSFKEVELHSTVEIPIQNFNSSFDISAKFFINNEESSVIKKIKFSQLNLLDKNPNSFSINFDVYTLVIILCKMKKILYFLFV